MKQIRVGVSGVIEKSHQEAGVTFIDEFRLDGASILAGNLEAQDLIGPVREPQEVLAAVDAVPVHAPVGIDLHEDLWAKHPPKPKT